MLIVVMSLMTILLSLGLSYLKLSGYNSAILLNDSSAEQAFYIAEAGLEDAASELIQNPAWRSGFSAKAFRNGSYTVSVMEVSPNIEVTSTATLAGVRTKTRLTEGFTLSAGSFKYGIQADGNINMNSSYGIINGDLNANSANLGGVTLQGESSTATDSIPAPDWSAWQAAATVVISGNHTFSAGTYSGVWYIEGNATINSNVTISGTVIATGNIDYGHSDHIVIISGSNNTALISGNNIVGNNASDLQVSGLVYAANNIVINNQSTATYYGILFAGNNVNSNSSSSIQFNYNADLAVHFPYYFTDPDGMGLKVSAWK